MKSKKRLAGEILKVSPKKISFVADALEDIKKAITRSDLRGLIAIKKIVKSRKNQQSRARARKIATQKRKGRQKGQGSKKGAKHATVTKKEKWMAKVRIQRRLLKELRDKKLISTGNYRLLYRKVKGGFFRNKRHIKLYLTEYHLIEEKK
ncbi:50S ribosomal protein L19e [Candidatus Woesearchaeota archaeon]|jgi:large subunit ribosomal protein L19e|nr:50S ribosomal protein L19e [Candidatus Woesearchaeota archaeon]MBT4110351.1 50S ribosomal protein L19e [Candidatus Woesearchaeota archaeon]MBT4336125.1 50S ribosomal protein L19e [Candidatus Woesearchaeota archaeon]MBT4468896.1 50S ribosomal protein L19e [Candidatus Woesearchaeota archaeon]MBT6744785.1 50S ribosomal protein L19e [Candidatus Woesearchaeota archaeon]